MKKLFGSLIALICVVACVLLLPIEADAATEGYYTYEVSDGQAIITDVDTTISGAITIPSTLGGCPVTGLGRGAFSGCDSLTGVTIPDSVTSIGDDAFSNCTSLTSITIPDSVTSIGEYAFFYCTGLTNVTIPDSVTDIVSSAFRYCTSLTSITIPDSVTSIGEYAFLGCNMTSITIPDSVTSIGLCAFHNCSSLTSITIPDSVTSIVSPAFNFCSSLNGIWVDEKNPAYCSDSNGVLFSKDMTACIQAPGGITGSYSIPDSVTSIGDDAFFGCGSLQSITIPDSVTSIGAAAFMGCNSLQSITIPDSITSIGDDAFSSCSSLTSITIPNSVTHIGDEAFYVCDDLTSVTYCGTEEQWNAISIGSKNTPLTNAERSYHNWQDAACTAPKKCIFCGVTEGEILGHNLGIYITKAAEFTHTNASNYPFTNTSGVWYSTNKTHSTSATYTLTATSSGAVTIDYGVSSESNYDKFTVNLNGTTIATISGSTTGSKTMELSAGDKITFTYSKDGSVSNGSDSGWFKIADCEIFDTSVTTQNCTDDVYCDRCNMLIYAAGHNYLDATCTAPKTCTTCGGTDGEALGHYYASGVCSVCGDIQILSSGWCGTDVNYILYGSGTLVITGTGDMIDYNVYPGYYDAPWYTNREDIQSVVIQDGVTGIGSWAFAECSGLTSVIIPDSVTTIGNHAFYYCTSLADITLPDGITDIAMYTFSDCYSLTGITIPDGVTTIGETAFRRCTGLTSITIPDSVTTLDFQAFYNCSGLTNVTIGKGVTSIGEWAFRGCTSLTSVTVPNSVTSIGRLAFFYCTSLTTVTIPASVTVIDSSAFESCDSLTNVTYCGTQTQWNAIDIGTSNTDLTGAARNYHNYIDQGVITKPTLTAPGQQQKTCSVCGNTITETLDMLVGEVSGWNVTLCDDLRVNFHLTISESIENTARVRIVVGEEGHTFRVSGLEKTEDGLYIASVHIAAAQMTDFIFVTVINGSDLAETASYTVRGYAETILADEDFSQYHQLVREMLNYGAAAQVYFDYEEENLANEGIADAGSVEIPDSVDNALSVAGNAEDVTFYGASLIFRNKITMRYYFRFKGDINDCSFAVNDTTYSPQLKDGLYYVEIADILPQNLDEEITLMVTDAEGNSLKVCYNPMNYIVRMNEKGSAALQNLVKALYNYHLAAKALQETV